MSSLSESIRKKIDSMREEKRTHFEKIKGEIDMEIHRKTILSEQLHTKFDEAVRSYQKLIESRSEREGIEDEINPFLKFKYPNPFLSNSLDSNLGSAISASRSIDTNSQDGETQNNNQPLEKEIHSIDSNSDGEQSSNGDSPFNNRESAMKPELNRQESTINTDSNNQRSNPNLKVKTILKGKKINYGILYDAINAIGKSIEGDKNETREEKIKKALEKCYELKDFYDGISKSLHMSRRRLDLCRRNYRRELQSFDRLERELIGISDNFEVMLKDELEDNLNDIVDKVKDKSAESLECLRSRRDRVIHKSQKRNRFLNRLGAKNDHSKGIKSRQISDVTQKNQEVYDKVTGQKRKSGALTQSKAATEIDESNESVKGSSKSKVTVEEPANGGFNSSKIALTASGEI
ncbi:hypothetical protein K502DRAFT_366281 [Neoconidiobolus thromboides FSU 785]|nr:hypothetical protein K502DRAFT_366281 [Neoconidiobolus thromboides FSU 785]